MRASRRQLTLVRSLNSRKGREESGLFLVEGKRLCEELLPVVADVEFVLFAEELEEKLADILDRFRAAGANIFSASLSEFERISDTVNSQGILAAARWREKMPDELQFGKRAIVLALDGISDPGNVGTIIRAADWFGASAVLLGEGCADLLNPKTVRATMGGMFHLPVCRKVDLASALALLHQKGFAIAAATMDGDTNWRDWAAPERAALLLGSEAAGISPELEKLSDRRITIKRCGQGESLNVALAAGVFLSAI